MVLFLTWLKRFVRWQRKGVSRGELLGSKGHKFFNLLYPQNGSLGVVSVVHVWSGLRVDGWEIRTYTKSCGCKCVCRCDTCRTSHISCLASDTTWLKGGPTMTPPHTYMLSFIQNCELTQSNSWCKRGYKLCLTLENFPLTEDEQWNISN